MAYDVFYMFVVCNAQFTILLGGEKNIAKWP